MGFGVARQCSRNRCRRVDQSRSLILAAEAEPGRANSKKDLVTGPIRGFCALQARTPPPSPFNPRGLGSWGGRAPPALAPVCIGLLIEVAVLGVARTPPPCGTR